jgi:hypothetical protein
VIRPDCGHGLGLNSGWWLHAYTDGCDWARLWLADLGWIAISNWIRQVVKDNGLDYIVCSRA